MKMHFIQVCCWLVLLLPSYAFSQSVLDNYVAEALANNLSLRSFDLSELRQQSVVDQAQRRWMPSVDLGASYLLAEGGRLINFPIGDLFNPVYGTLNELTGSQSFPENLQNVETQLTPNNFVDASLSISKPILNSAIKYNILIQKAAVSLSGIDKEIAANDLAFQVKSAYYNLLKIDQGVRVLEENIRLFNEVRAFNEKLIKFDKATPDVISDIDFQIAQFNSQIVNLDEQRRIAQILLNTLMNRDVLSPIVMDTTVITLSGIEAYELTDAVTTALANRPEFRKLAVAQSINDLNSQRIQAGKQPTLNVRGAIGIQTEEFTFDAGGPLYTLGVSMGWNIYDGGLRKRQLEELQIAREQNKLDNDIAEQQIALQVAQAYHRLQAMTAQLSTEEAAITAAQISFDAIKNRYENARALLIELITAQNQLTTARLNKTLTSIDLLTLKADLDRLIYER